VRHPIRRALRPTTLLLPAVLLLAGCGEGDADTGAAAAEAEAAEDAVADDAADDGDLDAEVGDGEEAPAEAPFDPDAEIHPADIEVREWGVGEPERPWEVLILPDDFVVPATAQLVTWAPPEEPFDESRRHGGSGAFRLHDAEPDDVAAFFTDRLPDRGWELTEEQHGDRDGWVQIWVTHVPFDGWSEDWMADERAVQVEVRFTYLARDGAEPDTMQMHYRAENVRHDFEG
jgi:hypothetical protein